MNDMQESIPEFIKTIRNPEIPEIYFNSFSTHLGNGDILIILERNGIPIFKINSSYTMAKTLAIKISETISLLESKIDSKIFTSDQINNAVFKVIKKDEEK
jgi:hypothetical protein